MSADDDVLVPALSSEGEPALAQKASSTTTRSADPRSVMPYEAVQTGAPRVRDPERYEVICEHGRGGLGRVSRVHDRELGRDVAIKELLSRGPISEARFAREARITARLEHPGIVPVHEAGRWPDGTPFYAMKLVSGRPLRALIAERGTVDERIQLLHHVIAVADAMAYAHGQNIIHRDLKPANVIVGDFGETVVIDWGLAKDLSDRASLGGDGSSGSSGDGLTRAGSVLGTPAYMAPEQERGEAVDQRADVFAIGAMLWELCSLHKVPPAERRLRRRLLRRAGIDDDLAAILDKAIDPDPARRYADAGELAADLKAFKSGSRIAARRYSVPAMVKHWARRHRALAAGSLALAAIVVASVIALVALYRAAEENSRAARWSARTAEARLVDAYVDQARLALLDGSAAAALPRLVAAAHHGDHSPALRFMLERAAVPAEVEVLRLPAMAPRAWRVGFSSDGRRVLSADDLGGRMWDARDGRLVFSMPHRDVVRLVQLTSDERRVVTIGSDCDIKVWDTATGALVRAMSWATQKARCMRGAMSPDDQVVAVANESGTVAIWELASGTQVTVLSAPRGDNVGLEFSRDNQWLVAGWHNELRVFHRPSWRVVTTRAISELFQLQLDSSGTQLATGTWAGEIAVWSVPDGRLIREPARGVDTIHGLAFSPDSSQLAAAFFSRETPALVWDLSSSGRPTRIAGAGYKSQVVRFDATGDRMVSGGSLGRFILSDARSGVPLLRAEGGESAIWDLRLSPDGRRLAGASAGGTVHIWDTTRSERQWATQEIAEDCGTLTMSDEERRYVAVSCPARSTRVWDTVAQRLIAELPAVDSPLSFAAPPPVVARAGDQVAIARGDRVDIYDLPSAAPPREIALGGPVTSVAYGPAGHALASASSDGVLHVFEDGRELLRARTSAAIDVVAVLPGRRVLVADATPRLRLIDIDTGAELAMFPLHVRVEALRLSEDARRVVAVPQFLHVAPGALYDLQHGVVARLLGHTGQLRSARFVREDHDLLTTGADGTARLWDAASGKLKQTFATGAGFMYDAVLSSDASMVIVGGTDGTLWFFRVDTGVLIWKMRVHRGYVKALQLQGERLVTRGRDGDLASWVLAKPSSAPDWLARFDRLVACGPWQFDEATGELVAQTPRLCPAP